MPTYVLLMKYTEEGIKTIRNAPLRIEQPSKVSKGWGAK